MREAIDTSDALERAYRQLQACSREVAVAAATAFALMVAAAVAPAAAQSPRFGVTQFSTDDGLSSNEVNNVLVDSRGFIWIGTTNGLNRYDGYAFREYLSDPRDSLSLPNNFITSLSEDRDGGLWVGTHGGLCRLDSQHDAFSCYGQAGPAPKQGLVSVRVLRAVQDRFEDRYIWVATQHGLDRLDVRTSEVEHFTPPGRQLYVRTVFQDAEGTVWIGTKNDGLGRLDARSRSLEFFRDICAVSGTSGNREIESIFEAPGEQGVLWLGTIRSVCRMDIASGEVRRFDVEGGKAWLSESLEDSQGRLWFATAGGLRRLAADGSKLDLVDVAGPQPDFGSIVEDFTGHLWLGSTSGGLYRVDIDRMNALRFKPRRGDVRVFLRVDGGLLVGVTHGLLLEQDEGSTTRLTLRGLWPRQLLLDKEGDLWMLDYSAGGMFFDLDRPFLDVMATDDPEIVLRSDFDPHTCEKKLTWPRPHRHRLVTDDGLRIGDLVHYSRWIPWALTERTLPELEVPEHLRASASIRNTYRHLYADPLDDDLLWTSTGVGLVRVERSSRNLSWFERDPSSEGGLRTNEVYQTHRDTAGRLWLATDMGLETFDPRTETFEHFASTSEDPRPPTESTIYCLYEDPHRPGTLWLGTDAGLASLDLDSGVSEWHSGGATGLPAHPVHNIVSDASGSLWLAFPYRESQEGLRLMRFDPAVPSATVYVLPRAIDPVVADPRSGRLLIGGLAGYFELDPSQLRAHQQPPRVVLYEPVVAARERFDRGRPGALALWSGTGIRLEPGERDIRFEYVGLHYDEPYRNRYETMLEGYDEVWRAMGDGRVAQYTNLAPGSYRFRVRAASPTGAWSDPAVPVQIVVKPPWYRTGWAFLLYLISAVLLLAVGERLRHASIVRREQHRSALRESTIRSKMAEARAAEAAEHATRLQELDEAKSRFFANVSHEFRTPLTLILGPLEDAMNGVHGDVAPGLERDHRVMRRSARRLLHLVDELLDLSKLEAGALELRAQEGDLVAFLREIVRSFEPLAERRRITLTFVESKPSVVLAFDARVLDRVFGNLISNALKFTPPGGRVTVSMMPEEDGWDPGIDIAVTDSGPGISEQERERIFERFHRIEAGADHGGAGIGLALVRELVALHRGRISVASEPGQGATFTVRVPTGLEASFDPEPATRSPLDPVSIVDLDGTERALLQRATDTDQPERPTILIVDDNDEVRRWLRSHLENDYRVFEAGDGEVGLDRAREVVPDLILLDVMMPGMDGYTVCRVLKASAELRHIPVLMLTARSGEEAVVRGLRSGADDYIEKPFSMLELKARIFNFLVSRRQLQEHFRRTIVVSPADVEITSEDESLLDQVLERINEHLSDGNYSVEWLANEVGLSRRQLDRRIHAMTGRTPADVIRRFRMDRASQLLRARAGNVSEIAYAVGFKSPAHFSKAFREHFGDSPSRHALLPAEREDVQN